MNRLKSAVILTVLILLVGMSLSFAQQGGATEGQGGVRRQGTKNTNKEDVTKLIEKFEDAINAKSTKNIKDTESKIKKMGKGALPKIIESIKNKNKIMEVRGRMMRVLSEIDDDQVADVFKEIIMDKTENKSIRYNAIHNLGQFSFNYKKASNLVDKNHMKYIKEIADDNKEDLELRREALTALGEIGQDAALPFLVAKLKEDKLRVSAVYGMGCVRTEKGREELIKGFQNESVNAIVYAHLFGRYKIKKAVPILLEKLKSIKGNSVSENATKSEYIKTLGRIGDKTAQLSLIEITNGDDLLAVEDAAISLCLLGNNDVIIKFIEKAKKENNKYAAKRLERAYNEIVVKGNQNYQW